MSEDVSTLRVGMVGYGEVGKIFAEALRQRGVASVQAFDIAFADKPKLAEMQAHAAKAGVKLVPTVDGMVADCDLVISAVTASETRNAARSVTRAIRKGAYFVDINSASPKTKADCGALVDAASARYVESAVMTSVPPYGIKVPMLLGGKYANEFAPRMVTLGFDATAVSEELGVASAIKMCRSVIIKGMEAIVVESFLTARKYGVEKHVIASLMETFPQMEWEKNGTYFWSRVVQHGKRRSEEMREAAATVAEAGFEPFMASAIADRQAWVAELARSGAFAGVGKPLQSWRQFADCIDSPLTADRIEPAA